MIEIQINDTTFRAELHEQQAPETVAALRAMLPLHSELMHVR